MKRILVLQLCRFGDILQTTPMLRGLRVHHPGAHITLVLHDQFEHVPVPRELFDRLAAFPYTAVATSLVEDARGWPEEVARLRSFVASLGSEPFDLVLNLTHSDQASLLCAAIPSRRVHGGLVAADRTRTVCGPVMTYFWASQLSRAHGCFNLVDLHNWTAGIPSERSGLEIEVSHAAHERMRCWLEARGLTDKPFIAVQLGASDERKRWPPELVAEALNRLEPEFGDVVLVGTESERELADRASARLERRSYDSLGQADIVELGALLTRARLLLTNDTGTMHVAAAVGTRVVDLSTGPVFAHETGPYGEGHLVLEPRMDCFPCVAGAECHHLACRESFAPDDVAALMRYALGRGPLPRPADARILTGRFRPSGALEYRPLWSPDSDLHDVIRPASADMWEPFLVPGAGATTMASVAPMPAIGTSELPASVGAAVQALRQLASRARRTAQLAGRLTGKSGQRQVALGDEIGQALEVLRLEGERHEICQPIVMYLKVRLDSCPETELGRLAGFYQNECRDAATRADWLVERLAVRSGWQRDAREVKAG